MPEALVVRTCAIGDFVFNLPALIALQRTQPETRFTLVGNASTLAPAKTFVAVDAVHSLELQPWARLFYEPIPGLEFDNAIVWMKDPVVADNLRASGIRSVIRAIRFRNSVMRPTICFELSTCRGLACRIYGILMGTTSLSTPAAAARRKIGLTFQS